MISLVPATAGDRHDATMSQQISQTAQERVGPKDSRKRRRKEEKEEEFPVDEASSSNQESPSGQDTTTTTNTAGHTILIRRTEKGDESARTKKTDNELGQKEEIDIEGQEEMDVEEQEKVTDGQESGSTDDNDDESGDESSVVEFEDPVYELSQTYKMEPEYESMTLEQEPMEVQVLTQLNKQSTGS